MRPIAERLGLGLAAGAQLDDSRHFRHRLRDEVPVRIANLDRSVDVVRPAWLYDDGQRRTLFRHNETQAVRMSRAASSAASKSWAGARSAAGSPRSLTKASAMR